VGALAYLTVPALIGPVIGPPLGGFITTYFHWRWIFWINVPIGILGVVLATIFVPNIKEERPWPLDKVGFVLSGLGLSALMFGFTVAGRGFLPVPLIFALLAVGTALVAIYIIHARRTPYPIIDLKLLAIPTFRASVGGGFLFRLGIGALPFLLPLMLQIGIGMTPFQSGCLTLASAAGAMAMKTTAQRFLRRFGFRQVLAFNALISSAFMAVYGTFGISTPVAVIFALLLVGGFFRSLEFTGINAIAYADIDNKVMSRATSFASVAQQLAISTGVAVGAGVIETSQWMHGDPVLRLQDFGTAFFVVAAISAASALVFLRLRPDAGAAMSGHRTAAYAPATAESSSGAAVEPVPRNPVART
jgi:predicted MFS family arabinose efflux permease